MSPIHLVFALLLFAGSASGSEMIITSSALYSQANELKNFHEQMGVKSAVVTVEEIAKNFNPAQDPPIYGYANESSSSIINYNYELAKKIIAYLRTIDVEFVTIFGDADIVPPSYYAKDSNLGWYPTDFFYMSPNYDLKPDFAVGRIPVSTTTDASKVVAKIKNWYSELSSGNYKNAIFIGTKIYATYFKDDRVNIEDYEVWSGELAVKYAGDIGLMNRFNSKILLQSDYKASEMKQFLDEAFSGGYGLLYHSGHGTVTGIDMGGIIYTTVYISKLSKKNPVLPVVVSDGCGSAAYDEEIMPSYFSTMLNWYGAPKYPWAEYILIRDAGAIAFVGFTRTTESDFSFAVSNGQVEVSQVKHAQAILSNFVKKMPGNHLGLALKDSLAEYSSNVNSKPSTKSEDWALRIYLMTQLIGDPTLKFPNTEVLQSDKPVLSISGKILSISNGVPSYEGAINFSFDKIVSVKIFDLTNGSVPLIASEKNVSKYTFNPQANAKYLLRASDGLRESWYTFYAKPNLLSNLVVSYPSYVAGKVAEEIVIGLQSNKNANCRLISAPSGTICENMTIKWTPKLSGDHLIIFEVYTESEKAGGMINISVSDVNLLLTSPKNLESGLSLSPKLCANVDSYCKVEFYSKDLIGSTSGKGELCVYWQNLEENMVYEWRAVAYCGDEVYRTENWTFKTSVRPVADFEYTISGNKVKFTSKSYDEDNQQLSYKWDFGDGSASEGCEVEHVYNEGEYQVTLTVTDTTNLKNSITKAISIKSSEEATIVQNPIPESPSENPTALGSRDLDKDGLYEDINGDGVLDFNDIAYFQWNFNKPEFQNYVKYYDFYPDGKVDLRDVLNLYVYWMWGEKRW